MLMDFDQLVENHFAKETPVDFENLLSLIEETLDSGILLEKALQQLDLSWSMIPEIPVSEIGWSTMETTPGAKRAEPSGQRKQLIQFLSNIAPDGDIQEKIKSLNDFYHSDPADLLKSGFFGDSSASQISRSLSYLIFFKTLTTIITHFNASSAGFSFESFLGVLLGGEQIPTGHQTIADLTTGDGTPISLKLYTEGQLEVGGSYTDLVRDLVRDDQMQYIAVTKTLERPEGGSRLATGGMLRFMRFNFNTENIFNLLSKSNIRSRKTILLPLPFMQDPTISVEDLKELIPAREYFPSPEEMESEYLEILGAMIGENGAEIEKQMGRKISFEDGPHEEDVLPFEQVVQALQFGDGFSVHAGSSANPGVPGKSQLSKRKVGRKLFNYFDIKGAIAFEASPLVQLIIAANEELRNRHVADERTKARQAKMTDLYFYGKKSDEELIELSRDFYDKLPSADLKKKALTISRGYVDAGHFLLTQKMVQDVEKLATPTLGGLFPAGQTEVGIGNLEFGIDNVMIVVEGIRSILNESVFEIFANMKELSINLQAYFAEGLQHDDQADTAINAAQNIETKTEEIKSDIK